MGAYNPIASVTPCNAAGTATGAAVTNLLAPSYYKWGLKDISGPGAGRTEDMVMHKKRKGQARAIGLTWKNITLANAAAILTAYDSEYLLINHLNLKTGTWITKRFYVGDRNAPLYNSKLGLVESVEFTIIQQDAAI